MLSSSHDMTIALMVLQKLWLPVLHHACSHSCMDERWAQNASLLPENLLAMGRESQFSLSVWPLGGWLQPIGIQATLTGLSKIFFEESMKLMRWILSKYIVYMYSILKEWMKTLFKENKRMGDSVYGNCDCLTH